ncbi:MAG: flagellar basal body L-ring protein FlgH, partial [candidate division Zixibacteria bacterium]|nr:flagellar basal body L-ring protein FlgH [candidate division Zixibacteria bacterium]
QRIVAISGDREVMTLTGVVRPKDIGGDNTIQSYLIADADIRYTGKGNSNTASRPGFITRLLNWIF